MPGGLHDWHALLKLPFIWDLFSISINNTPCLTFIGLIPSSEILFTTYFSYIFPEIYLSKHTI